MYYNGARSAVNKASRRAVLFKYLRKENARGAQKSYIIVKEFYVCRIIFAQSSARK